MTVEELIYELKQKPLDYYVKFPSKGFDGYPGVWVGIDEVEVDDEAKTVQLS